MHWYRVHYNSGQSDINLYISIYIIVVGEVQSFSCFRNLGKKCYSPCSSLAPHQSRRQRQRGGGYSPLMSCMAAVVTPKKPSPTNNAGTEHGEFSDIAHSLRQARSAASYSASRMKG